MTALWSLLDMAGISRRRLVRALLLAITTMASALLLATLSAWLITRAWQMPPVLDLSVAVVAVRALGISRGVFRYLDRLAGHDLALRAASTMRVSLYSRMAEHRRTPALRAGTVLRRTGTDVDAVADTVVRSLIPIGVAGVMCLAAAIGVGLIMPLAGLVLAVAMVCAGILAPLWSARATLAAEAALSAAAEQQTEAMALAVHCGDELAVAGQIDALTEDIRRCGEQRRAAEQAVDRASAVASAATPAAMLVATIVIVLLGVSSYESAALSPMELGILVLVPLAAFESVGQIPGAVAHLVRAQLAARRITAMLDATGSHRAVVADGGAGLVSEVGRAPEVGLVSEVRREVASTSAALVQAQGLVWGYTEPLGGPLDLCVAAGERLIVRGPSGSGKSALACTLAGIEPALEGTVLRGGELVYQAEDAHIFATTVRDNLLVIRGNATDCELLRALDQVGLSGWLGGLPDGLGTVLSDGAASVSGGQRRRLLLARMLLSQAPVLILDEPTEHLDAQAAAELLRQICRPGGDGLFGVHQAVIVITHDQATELAGAREMWLDARE